MLADKTDRHHHQIVRLGLSQLLKRFFGVWLQPLHRTNPTLISKGVGVGVAHVLSQRFHDQIRAGLDLLLIRVSGLFHIALGDAMGTEENVGLFRVIAVAHFFSNQLGHRLDVAGMVKPAADATDRQLFKGSISLTQPLQLPEAGSAGADGEMGIKRQHHHLIHAVRLHICHGGFREWMPVPHRDVGGGVESALPQKALQFPRLLFGDPAQR